MLGLKSMYELANPWVLLMLPLPLVVRALLPSARQQQSALRLPFYAAFANSRSPTTTTARWWQWLVSLLIWLCLLLALARPQSLGEPVQQERAGRNILLAIDISQSMALTDLDWLGKEASRLQVVKAVAGEFIEQRVGDRLGLILFGSKAYVQTPLTFDRQTVKEGLFDASIGLAGKQTAIGDALGLGVKHLQDTPEQQRVLVLLTDGVSNVGIDPLTAAQAAKQNHVKVYPIAFGHDNVVIDTVLGPKAMQLPLDETILKTIAEETGGQYFRAEESKALQQVYKTLNKIEKISVDEQVFRTVHEWYYFPAGVALALVLLQLLLKLLVIFSADYSLFAKRRETSKPRTLGMRGGSS